MEYIRSTTDSIKTQTRVCNLAIGLGGSTPLSPCLLYLAGLHSGIGSASDCRSRDRKIIPAQPHTFRGDQS